MINSSSALSQSPDFLCEFCNSTTYVYCKFNNCATNNISATLYFENDVETSQSSDNQEDRQILPITPKSEKSFNPFMLETPEINKSEVAGVNSKKGFSASSNKNQLEMYPAANAVMYKPLKRSTNNINLENNVANCSKQLNVPKTGVKRKLFDTVKPEIPLKKTAPKSKTVQDETYKLLPELSDSIADKFLQQFDREIGFGSVRKLGGNSTECFPKIKQEDLFKQCNLDNHRNLPKKKTDQRQQKAVPLLKEESFSNGNINFDINQSDLTSTSEESGNTNQTESTKKNDNKYIQKKVNFLIRSNSRSSVSSDMGSISSIASSVSRYGRIRKPSSVYVNATMFKGGVEKSAEIKQKSSNLINSHKCQNGRTGSFEATSRYCPNQLDILPQTQTKMISSQFRKSASKITSSKNRQTTRQFQNNTRSRSWRNSSFIEELPELLQNQKILELQKPTRQTTSTAAESNFIDEKLELQYGTSTPSALISDYPEQLNLNQSPLCSQCKKSKGLIRNYSSGKEIFKKPLAKNASPKSQKFVVNNCGKILDPNEIHAVVKDEVVSFKWYSATPDLESVLGNGANVYYSMQDLKSFYTNVAVGYLKIDVGDRKPMTVLKDYILLYFVERGEGVFKVSGRKIAGQIGSTVFIPLGIEYSIKNSSAEEDFILKFVIISPSI